jgi:DNA-directed RNA polymerase specialized sigma24 family protein
MSCFIMSCRGCGYSASRAQLTTWNMGGGARIAHRLILRRQRSRVRQVKIGMPADLQQVAQRSPPSAVETAAGAASGQPVSDRR